MDSALQMELNSVKVDVFAVTMVHKEPVGPFIINRDYKEINTVDIPYSKFGFASLRHFLENMENISAVQTDEGIKYKAKVIEEAANVQRLIAQQKSKKRKRNGTSGYPKHFFKKPSRFSRFGFQNPSYGFFQSRTVVPRQPPIKARQVFPVRPVPKVYDGRYLSACINFRPGSQALVAISSQLQDQVKLPKVRNARQLVGKKGLSEEQEQCLDRIKGVLKSEKDCCTYETLVQIYNRRRKRLLKDDLLKLFGTTKIDDFTRDYLLGYVIIPVEDSYSDCLLVSKEKLDEQLGLEKKSQIHSVVREPETTLCPIPSIAKLFDNLTNILESHYPASIPLDRISDYYDLKYCLNLDPMEFYRKTWSELIQQQFYSRMYAKNGCVSLTNDYVDRHRLNVKAFSGPDQLSNSPRSDVTSGIGTENGCSEDSKKDESGFEEDAINVSVYGSSGREGSRRLITEDAEDDYLQELPANRLTSLKKAQELILLMEQLGNDYRRKLKLELEECFGDPTMWEASGSDTLSIDLDCLDLGFEGSR